VIIDMLQVVLMTDHHLWKY